MKCSGLPDVALSFLSEVVECNCFLNPKFKIKG